MRFVLSGMDIFINLISSKFRKRCLGSRAWCSGLPLETSIVCTPKCLGGDHTMYMSPFPAFTLVNTVGFCTRAREGCGDPLVIMCLLGDGSEIKCVLAVLLLGHIHALIFANTTTFLYRKRSIMVRHGACLASFLLSTTGCYSLNISVRNAYAHTNWFLRR